MASPRVPVTPATMRPITITPGSRVLDISSSTPSTNGRTADETIWKRLRDAGFDEDSFRRRDKAALIAYIAKLEAEIYDLEHNMGLLILERKDYASKFEEARLSAESAEVIHKRDQAALSSALAEARKREDNLKKALGIEKECVANIEKALHEMRAECAEVKVAADAKMAEARSMLEDAQRKYVDTEVKLRAAESLQDAARRCERGAERKLQEVEAREDDLRRRIAAFKSDCEAKEKENMLQRQSLAERQKVLSEGQNKLLDGKALLNQREADILSKSLALKKVEKDLEAQRESIASERRALIEQKSTLELNIASLSDREKDIIEKELLLNKKEQELIASQEQLAVKEHTKAQKILAEQEIALRRRRDEFEAQIAAKQKLAEEEIEKKRRDWELRELDLKVREDLVMEREQDLDVQSRVIADKFKDLAERIKLLEERESHLVKSEEEVEKTKTHLQKEREEIDQAKSDLEKSLSCLEEEKNRIAEERKKLELMKSETSELLILETKLKEEIDMIRAQNLELEAEAEKLRVEKAKFETEWEVIDDKREELRREEERITSERLAVTKFLKDERDSLNAEKEVLREQYKHDLESLSLDREAFRSESQHERSEWFAKFQQERADFLLDIEFRKKELEDCVTKKREDIEHYLREKEKSFEQEVKRELQYISSLKEDLQKEKDIVASELKKLEAEKLGIKLDREQRDKAWAELQSLIEELQMQRLKLKEQRELLHADREEIHSQIEHLKELEDLKVDSDRIVVPVTQQLCADSTPEVIMRFPVSMSAEKLTFAEDMLENENASPPGSTVSWLKKCASLIFKNSPDGMSSKQAGTAMDSESEDGKLEPVEKESFRINDEVSLEQGMLKEFEHVASMGRAGQSRPTISEEPKVIHEVPPVNDGVTEVCDAEVTKDVHDGSVPASETLAGRKRRVVYSSSTLTEESPLGDQKISKKRRQQGAEALKGFQDVSSQGMEFKQPDVAEDQYILSSSTHLERNEEEAVVLTNKVEEESNVSPKVADAGNCGTDVKQGKVNESGLVENEALTCVVLEQTVIEEVLIVDGEQTDRHHESEAAVSEVEQQERNDAPTDSNKLETIGDRRRRRSKAKQKA